LVVARHLPHGRSPGGDRHLNFYGNRDNLDDFLEGGKEGLKGQRPDRSPDDRALRQAERKVGQLTMENEILRVAAEKRGVQIPPAKRPR
jgi:hypothetical protein